MVTKSKLMVSKILLLAIVACNNNDSQNVAEAVKLNNNIDFSLEEIYCRQIHINDIINDRPKYQEFSNLIIGEPNIDKIDYDSFIRLIFEGGHEENIIISIWKNDNCWMKSQKIIPVNDFGVFPYLFQGRPIKYSTTLDKTQQSEFDDFSTQFHKVVDYEIDHDKDIQYCQLQLKHNQKITTKFISREDTESFLKMFKFKEENN